MFTYQVFTTSLNFHPHQSSLPNKPDSCGINKLKITFNYF